MKIFSQQIIGNQITTLYSRKRVSQMKVSKREVEILQLICEQYTTSEIAEKLHISPRTVDGHRERLLAKLNCRNTVGLVVYAIQNKLVEIDSIKLN